MSKARENVDKLNSIVETLTALNALAFSPVGSFLTARKEGYVYEVASPSATDHDVTTSGGVKLYVLPSGEGVWDAQFFDVANDADRINKAIQWTIKKQKTVGELYKVLVVGNYTLDKPIKCFDFTGTSYEYVTVSIEAPTMGYAFTRKTNFVFTDKNECGIVAMALRAFKLKGISLQGAANNRVLPSYQSLLDRDGWWNPNGAVDFGSFKKHTGIMFDPFYSLQALNERFAYFDGSGTEPNHYVEPDRSTGIASIEECEIQGFIWGICCSGSDLQLGDSITIDRCNLSYNKNAVVIGESQNRGIAVNACHGKGHDVFFVGGSGYAAGTGSGNYINGGVFVFNYAFVAINTERGNGACNDVYVEATWTIGQVTGGHGFRFNDCQIKLLRSDLDRGVSAVLTGDGAVTFNGGYYGYYTALPYQMAIGQFINITGGAVFDAPPTLLNWTSNAAINFVSGNFRFTQVSGRNIGNIYNGSAASTLGSARYLLTGQKLRLDDLGSWEVMNATQRTFISNATASIDGNGVVTLTGIDTSNIFVNDSLFSETSQIIDDNSTSTQSIQYYKLGDVKTINVGASSCVLSGGSKDLEDGKTYTVFVTSFPTVRRPRQASMTNGSNILTNAGIITQDWYVGGPIRGNGIPADTRVAAVVAGQITMTKNATATQTTDIYDGYLVPCDAYNTVAPFFGNYHRGSVTKNIAPSKDANNMILVGWVCTAGGAPGTWEPMYQSAVTPAT